VESDAKTRVQAEEALTQLPLYFIENRGQRDERVTYYTQQGGADIYFTAKEVVMALPDTVLRTRFVSGNQDVRITGGDEQEARFNYFIGNDRDQWQRNACSYAEVTYHDVYTGVDLTYTGHNGALKYEFVVQPGGDVKAIHLAYAGVTDMQLAENGDLFVTPEGAETSLRDTAPIVYQEIDGERLTVDAAFILYDDQSYGFAVGEYDPDSPLVIDPQLRYSTFLGGSESDWGDALALDSLGNVYLTGGTRSGGFPATAGAYDQTPSGGDVFVSVLDPTLSTLCYSTFLGGSGDDWGNALVLDDAGNVYVTGDTKSTDFPTTVGAYDRSLDDHSDIFVSVLDLSLSSLSNSGLLGGSGWDSADAISLDVVGNVYLTGSTSSSDFPTTVGAYDSTHNGGHYGYDAFVSLLDSRLSSLFYSTFLGGSGDEQAEALALSHAGNVYVAGYTSSSEFPTTPAAYDQTYNGSGVYGGIEAGDVFISMLEPALNGLLHSTFLGGSKGEAGSLGLALDSADNVYLTGGTESSDFPATSGVYDTSHNGYGYDVFVSGLNPALNRLRYSTFLGGSSHDDIGCAIAVDAAGNAFLTGVTYSADFPTTGGYDSGLDGRNDAFVSVLDHTLSTLSYSTFLGGGDHDRGAALAVGDGGNTYVIGETWSGDFPTTAEAYDRAYGGEYGGDGFVSVLDTGIRPLFSISGHVRGSDNNPLVGVTVSVGSAGSSTTDAYGTYIVTDLPPGTYTLTPSTSGYLWSPEVRSVTVPPDAKGQDFTGRNIRKRSSAVPSNPVAYEESITYTVSTVYPEDCTLAFYDPVPTNTSYVTDSLNASIGITYDLSADAISGTLTLSSGVPQTVTFGVRVEVTGTAEHAPVIVNRACIHPPDSGMADCEWSNEVVNFTYVWPVYLPLVTRGH
jgi:hypothetical protein